MLFSSSVGNQVYARHARKPDCAFHLEAEHSIYSWKREDRDRDVLLLHIVGDRLGQVEGAEGHVVGQGHLLELIHQMPEFRILPGAPFPKELLYITRVNITPLAERAFQLVQGLHPPFDLTLGGVDSLILAPEFL